MENCDQFVFYNNTEIFVPAEYAKVFENLRARDMIDPCFVVCFNLSYVITCTVKYQ